MNLNDLVVIFSGVGKLSGLIIEFIYIVLITLASRCNEQEVLYEQL